MVLPDMGEINREYKMLREELKDLKTCQMQFLTYAVTATGLLFGIINWSSSDSSLPENVTFLNITAYLIPLIVILPAWMIFFDKTKSTNRIMGYLRVLERFGQQNVESAKYIGWENAVDKARDFKYERLFKCYCITEFKDQKAYREYRNKKIVDMAVLRTYQTYQMVVYYVFMIASLICIFFEGITLYQLNVDYFTVVKFIIVPTTLMVFVALTTYKTFIEVNMGKFSSDLHKIAWEKILDVKEIEYNIRPECWEYILGKTDNLPEPIKTAPELTVKAP
jgi:hypothetical protein